VFLIGACLADNSMEPSYLLKHNAIAIESLSALLNKIYKEIADYEIIMVGEMHVTNEPAEFAVGLCE